MKAAVDEVLKNKRESEVRERVHLELAVASAAAEKAAAEKTAAEQAARGFLGYFI